MIEMRSLPKGLSLPRKSTHVTYLLVAGLLILTPLFLNDFIVFFIASAAITAIMVLSLNIALGYGGLLSLVHTGLFMFAAYATAILAIDYGLSPWTAAPVAVILTILVGLVVAGISLRAQSLYFGIITLAFNLVLVELARQLNLTGGSQGLFGVPRPNLGERPMSDFEMYYLVMIALGLTFMFHRNLVRSASGRAIRATRESSESAASLGIAPFGTQIATFGYSTFVIAIAGALFALLNGFVVWTIGELRASIDLLLGLFLGGVGTVSGPVVGAASIAGARRLFANQAEIQALLLGVLMLLSILIVPGGIVGYFQHRNRKLPQPTQSQTEDLGVLEFLEVRESTEGPALQVRSVSKAFGGIQALKSVDIEVQIATVHGLIGPNGSGKSTLCDIITRLSRPDNGSVHLFGAPLPRRTATVASQGIVRVFQIPHLFDNDTALDNVMAGMHLHRRQTGIGAIFRTGAFRADELRLRGRAEDLLNFAGLQAIADVQTALLSHGQKRLVEVVRALGAQPRVLILDEPATGLTSKEVHLLAELLRKLSTLGLTILLIEHNLSLVMNVCDRITVFDGGIRIADGTPAEVRNSEEVRNAYLATDDLASELIAND